MATEGLRARLAQPVDGAGFVAFRVGFGLLATLAALRFVALGWVDTFLLRPRFHFSWIDGLAMPPAPLLYALFGLQALCGLGIAARVWPRACLLLWLSAFGYVELLDKTLYLNHYVLFTLLGLWLLVVPVHRVGLGDGAGLPRWALLLLRVQVGSVYVWAGLAKLNADWLLRAEPLRSWLSVRADLPLIGPLLGLPATAYAMSWAGAAYDLCIVGLLLHRRTRVLGFVLVVGFHVMVGALFPIGIFPLLMVLSATLFFAPDWPRRWLSRGFPGVAVWRPRRPRRTGVAPLGIPPAMALAVLMAGIVLLPARHLWLGQEVNWSERGFRFAWRVMLIEKTGLVDFRVVDRDSGEVWRVLPSAELSPLQHGQMRTQPDMIRDYALHLRDRHAARGRAVAVYADAWASLHGRPAQRLLRPDADLTLPVETLDSVGWIVPLREPGRP